MANDKSKPDFVVIQASSTILLLMKKEDADRLNDDFEAKASDQIKTDTFN